MYASTDWDNREYVVFNPDLVSRLGGSNPARVRVETQIGGPCVQNAFGTKYSDHGMVDFITMVIGYMAKHTQWEIHIILLLYLFGMKMVTL